MPNLLQDLVFNGSVAALAIWVWARTRRTRRGRAPSPAALFGLGLLLLIGCLVLSGSLFGVLRNLAWLLFVHVPLLLGALAWFSRRKVLPAVIGVSLALVGVWAFFIEPRMLSISTLHIDSAKVEAAFEIAVVADLQAERFGAYEQSVLEHLVARQPDLILLTGDYVQAAGVAARERVAATLRRRWRDLGVSAPMGVFVLQGDVDASSWESHFEGLDVETSAVTQTFLEQPVELIGLSLADSFDPQLDLPKSFGSEGPGSERGYRIVFGHGPDFALGTSRADLMIAGHTHGGQVRLPGIGPLITFSRVPRSWAAGATEVGPGRWLVVSRGIGMERADAPRLRFLCRPELLFVQVAPLEPRAIEP